MTRSVRYVGGMLAVVVGVTLVPAALALSPDDKAEPRGPGAVAVTLVAQSTRPDDRAEPRGPGSLPATTVRPDDQPMHGVGATTVPVVVTDSSTFDWTYVAVAGVVALSAAVVVGAVAMTRHHGGPGRLAPHS